MDIGWTELLLIGIVALIVVGPKDLPRMFAALGRFTAKARAMAREFQRAMDDAAKSSGINEATAEMKSMVSKKSLGLDKIEAAAKKFESWDPTKTGAAKPSAAASAAPGSETANLAAKKAAEASARRAVAAPGATEPSATPKPAGKSAAKKVAKPAAKTAAKTAAKAPAKAAKSAPAAKAAKAMPAARRPRAKAGDA